MRRKTSVIAIVLAALLANCGAVAGDGGRTGEWSLRLTWSARDNLDLQACSFVAPAQRRCLDPWHAWSPGPGSLRSKRQVGPGSETAKISVCPREMWQVYVFDATSADGSSLSRSGARLDVLLDGRKVSSLEVPQGSGNLWTPCSLFGSSVTPVGNLSNERDQRAVGRTLRSALIPGDVLLGAIDESLVPGAWSHAAIYAGDGQVIEAASEDEDVKSSPEVDWETPEKKWVCFLRVTTADTATRERAVAFARRQVAQQKPYDINLLSKQAGGDSWYCSELVWAAYREASGGRINLESTPDSLGVYPWEIEHDKNVAYLGGHFERKPSRSVKIIYLYAKLAWDHAASLVGSAWHWLWD